MVSRKKGFFDNLHNNYCIYGNAICHIARLTNIYRPYSAGVLLGESSSFSCSSSSALKIFLNSSIWIPKDRDCRHKLEQKEGQKVCTVSPLFCFSLSHISLLCCWYNYSLSPAWIRPKSTGLYKTILVSDNIIHVQHFIYRKSLRCSKVQTHEHPTVSIIQVLWYNTMFLNNIY